MAAKNSNLSLKNEVKYFSSSLLFILVSPADEFHFPSVFLRRGGGILSVPEWTFATALQAYHGQSMTGNPAVRIWGKCYRLSGGEWKNH